MGEYLKMLLTLITLLCGCSAPQTQDSQHEIRQRWAQEWINASQDPHLKQYYSRVHNGAAAPHRGNDFGLLSMRLFLETLRRPLSGSQLLDLIGEPDSITVEDSHAALKYFFTDDKTPLVQVMIVTLDDGMVTQIGWNIVPH